MWTNWRSSLKTVPEPSDSSVSLDAEYNLFKETILDSAHKIFSLADSSRPRRPGQPWWNQECEAAVSTRRMALKQFAKRPTPQNKTVYNEASKQAKEITKRAKEQAWSTFLCTLNSRTPITIVWKFFRAMIGGSASSSIPLSDQENNPADPRKSAEILADYYQENFSYCLPLDPEDLERLQTALSRSPTGGINSPITSQEFDRSISHTPSKSSPGNDLIHNQFLKNLPQEYKTWLLSLFNKSLESGSIPSDWKESLILPILKPSKDSTTPSSYRPISLLSCVGKLMERIISWRVQWYLETGSHLLPEQFGFRPCRSTVDPLSILEHTIQKSFRTQKITLVVFLDLSAAFDRAAPKAVLTKLAGMGVEGNILRWLYNYLSNRRFSVSVNSKCSDQRQITSSVPQGSVLSPALFNVLLSDLPQSREVKTLVYADDITLYVTATNLNDARAAMQEALNKFEEWTTRWGMQISPQKSCTLMFTQKRSLGSGPQLTIGNNSIPCGQQNKLLGVTLDSPNLTWRPHINNLIIKCHKRLNIMRCMAGISSGISRTHLKTFYTAYIKSVADYCLPIFSSAAPSTLQKLDVVHNTALRIITGAWRNTPIEALYCEAGLVPPQMQRASSCATQYAKLRSSPPDHPIHEIFRRDICFTYLKLGGKQYKMPLIYRVSHLHQDMNLTSDLAHLTPTKLSVMPPWWPVSKVVYCSSLDPNLMKSSPNAPIIIRSLISNYFQDREEIYTDGSLIQGNVNSVGASMFVLNQDLKFRWKLPDYHSIISAELFAISKALNFVRHSNKRAVIFTDSHSSLSLITQSIPSSYRNIIHEIQSILQSLPDDQVKIHWVPGHSKIHGNEIADCEAKKGAQATIPATAYSADFLEVKNRIKNATTSHWKTTWSSNRSRYDLGNIIIHPLPRHPIQNSSRKLEVIFAQLRLGSSKLNAPLFKIKQSDSPLCSECLVAETPSHYLLECALFQNERDILKASLLDLNINVFSLQELLNNPITLKLTEQFITSSKRYD